MNTISTGAVRLFVVVCFSLIAAAGASGSKEFTVNNAVGQNKISFISDAPMEKIYGTADGVSGSFSLDLSKLEATKGKIVVDVRSMKTAISRRDESMYSSQWLDADKYSQIVYDITGLKDIKVQKQDGKTVVSANTIGTFMCRGISKPLTASLTITYLNESSETKKRASGDLVMVTATFNVALKDHNIIGKQGLVGSKVGEVIAISASLFANSTGS